MAERHRLIRSLTLLRHPWRALQLIQSGPKGDHYQPRQNQARSSQGVGAAIKYLRHAFFPCLAYVSSMCALCWRSHLLGTKFVYEHKSPDEAKYKKRMDPPRNLSEENRIEAFSNQFTPLRL
jgi:hypothetical protein